MSQPLKLRLEEDKPAVPLPLQVLPSPPPAIGRTGAIPPPLPEPVAPVPSAQTPRSFLEPEEVDVMAGYEEQAALEAANESHWKGFLGGGLAALACTLVAGGFSALSGAWYGIFSAGIGFVVAFGVRRLGNGNCAQFGLIGATWALLGCLGAYHFANAIVMAREEGVSLLEFVRGLESWSGFLRDVLGPKDFLFYAIAMYFGYTKSYDAVADRY